jgi:hypothetical protein
LIVAARLTAPSGSPGQFAIEFRISQLERLLRDCDGVEAEAARLICWKELNNPALAYMPSWCSGVIHEQKIASAVQSGAEDRGERSRQ